MTNAKPSGDATVTSGESLCRTPAETSDLGARLAALLRAGDVVSLEGPLGAGKTQLVKGIVGALGHAGDVSSPTFTLVHEYDGGRLPVAHFDWYRLEAPQEVTGIGWDDYVGAGDGVVLVEWGDRFPQFLPEAAWRVVVGIEGGARRIRWEHGR